VKQERFQDMTDGDLLERYKAEGASEWMGLLLQRYTLLLFGVCLKYLKDEDEAKDAVQQIFLKVLTDVSRHKVEFFKAWLYMVAKNHCLMRLRDRNGKKQRELTNNLKLPHEDLKTFDLQENEATYAFLEQALHELTPEQQDCVILFYLQRKSYQQISARTGYSLLQVKSYIQNGKRNLKIAIEKKRKQQGAKR
jgi:RNA polymerase sigma-70 factor (ECF subfamily)